MTDKEIEWLVNAIMKWLDFKYNEEVKKQEKQIMKYAFKYEINKYKNIKNLVDPRFNINSFKINWRKQNEINN